MVKKNLTFLSIIFNIKFKHCLAQRTQDANYSNYAIIFKEQSPKMDMIFVDFICACVGATTIYISTINADGVREISKRKLISC